MSENQIQKIDKEVNTYLEKTGTLAGFQKAIILAKSIQSIKALLTKEVMEPITEMMGNKLGFKTDRDGGTSYPLPIVRNCLIEAVLSGVQPVGNQFNIIAGNCYITKEGFTYLLKNFPGLRYSITYDFPRISKEKTSAAIDATVTWSLNGGQENQKVLHIPIRMNARMGTDAVIGKADRKSRAWLYNHLTGNNLGDGDVESNPQRTEDAQFEEVSDDEEKSIESEMVDFINNCNDISELKANADFYQTDAEKASYQRRLQELQQSSVNEKKQGINSKIQMP